MKKVKLKQGLGMIGNAFVTYIEGTEYIIEDSDFKPNIMEIIEDLSKPEAKKVEEPKKVKEEIKPKKSKK